MVTLRDIAAHAGVSSATASRALAGHNNVSSQTRRRIEASAAELGYRVNAVARSLRTQRTDTIGLLLPDIRNPFFTELAYYVDKAAAQAGLTVMVGSADEQKEQQDRYLDALARHQVDGIIAVAQGECSCILRNTCSDIPTVFLDRNPELDGIACVSSDNHAGMSALVDHLVSLGHRRIGVLAGPQITSTGRERLAAIRERLSYHQIILADSDIAEGNFQLDSGVSTTEKLLTNDSYDALIAADNLMALGALKVLRQHGIRVGEEIALACVDDLEWFTMIEPAITVVAQDTQALGQAVVASLIARIKNEDVPSIQIPMTLIPRASCGEKSHHSDPEPTEVTHG
ncbi:MAG: LacI family DNA-binding transcriptional regulator [Propionibacteriaceae bacterium]